MVPSLHIDPAAREALLSLVQTNVPSLVATLCWAQASLSATSSHNAQILQTSWQVAFYARDSLPSGDVVEVEGISFFFGQGGEAAERLDGAVLIYKDGAFYVAECGSNPTFQRTATRPLN